MPELLAVYVMVNTHLLYVHIFSIAYTTRDCKDLPECIAAGKVSWSTLVSRFGEYLIQHAVGMQFQSIGNTYELREGWRASDFGEDLKESRVGDARLDLELPVGLPYVFFSINQNFYEPSVQACPFSCFSCHMPQSSAYLRTRRRWSVVDFILI